MLENSFGLSFFMKPPEKKETDQRFIYLRITVDGIRKETSTKRKWDVNRWDAKTERASGNKEDARVLNHFLDAMVTLFKNLVQGNLLIYQKYEKHFPIPRNTQG